MRLSLSRLAVLAVCFVAAGAAILPAGASAASGYHMTRPFVDENGDTARAVGKICTGSKFGRWRWHVTIGSGELRTAYKWNERIYPDGKARELRFTGIDSPFIDEQPTERLRQAFRIAVANRLNQITVKLAGKKLVYKLPSGSTSTKAFKPAVGC